MSKVKCEICKGEYHYIRRDHLQKHGHTREQYIEEFPDAKLFSEEYSETRSKIGEITGQIAIASGQISGLGRVWGAISGQKAKESGQISELGRIQGQKNVESGHLASIRTSENQSKGGKAQGPKNVESGLLDAAREKALTPEARAKALQTMIRNGNCSDPLKLDTKIVYKREINKLTKKNLSQVLPLIRTSGPVTPNTLTVDHIFSKNDGFNNNVSPKIIAHPANLRIITHSANSSKGAKSLITIEDLKGKIEIIGELLMSGRFTI